MKSNSEITLTGNLGQQPEVFALNSGGIAMRFSIAVSHWYKKQSGETVESTSWFNVALFGKMAESAKDKLNKGTRVIVFGEMIQREWTNQDGKLQKTYEVSCTSFHVLQKFAKAETKQEA